MNHIWNTLFIAIHIILLVSLNSISEAQVGSLGNQSASHSSAPLGATDIAKEDLSTVPTFNPTATPAGAAEPDQQNAKQQGATNQKKTPSTAAEGANQAENGATEEADKVLCKDVEEEKYTDCRGVFIAAFYTGLAIDTFAGDDMLKYLNPGDSGKIHERAIGGIDFEYRLLGDRRPTLKLRRDVIAAAEGKQENSVQPRQAAQPIVRRKSGGPCDPIKNENCRNVDWHPKNVWVYGETVHGVRSADVDCKKNADLPVCANNPLVTSNPEQQFFYMLRNATSLEGFFGLRWEFLGLQQRSSSPANLYLKGQAGFLSVAGSGGSALDIDHIALGAIATKGRYENSYLEVGYGRSDVFATARRRRVKVDGYLQRSLTKKKMPVLSAMSLFVQMFVDTDLGRGSDAIQSFVGLSFDLTTLFSTSNNTDTAKQGQWGRLAAQLSRGAGWPTIGPKDGRAVK